MIAGSGPPSPVWGASRSRSGLAVVLALAVTLTPLAATAGVVKGTVKLPDELKGGRRHRGHWRVENGSVPVQPAPHRGETVAVLEGPKGQAPGPATVTVELAGLQPTRPVVIVGQGSVVEFKNLDNVPHDLSIPDQPNVMELQRLNPGALRRQRFPVAGGYLVRDAAYPHIQISVIVVNTPFHGLVDERGGFKLPDVPDGKAKLKVWSHGEWVHEQEVDVGKSGDLQIKVEGKSGEPGE